MGKYIIMKYLLIMCMCFLIAPLIFAQSEEEEETVKSAQERELIQTSRQPGQLLESGVVVIQRGNGNRSSVDIHSEGESSGVLVTQIGDQNTTNVVGLTTQSHVGILQDGFYNDLSLDLQDDYNSELEFYQYGNNNTIRQKLNTSLNAQMTITQQGHDHLLDFETDLIEIPGLRITQMGQGAELIIVQ